MLAQDALHIFLSWSEERGCRLAEALESLIRTIFASAGVTTFFSKEEIRPGAYWREHVFGNLRKSGFGILCLTPENLTAPWILYEAGALSMATEREREARPAAGGVPDTGRGATPALLEGKVCPYFFEITAADLGDPLSILNGATADTEGTRRLIRSINATLDGRSIATASLDTLFDALWPTMEQKLAVLRSPEIKGHMPTALSRLRQGVMRALNRVREGDHFRGNQYFARVIFDSVDWVRESLKRSGPYYDVPLTLYPYQLISLLKHYSPVVKAIAIVDALEKFWPQREGEEIRKLMTEDSTRVFVFREREDLKRHVDMLIRHARKPYAVYALSHARLSADFPEFTQDFSIIGGASVQLLAYYVDSPSNERGALPTKSVRFSVLPVELSRHDEAFSGIKLISEVVEDALDSSDETAVEAFIDRVFKPEYRKNPHKQVEMSSYINVIEYDKHEEEHAYYQDMMAAMVGVLTEGRRPPPARVRVLEIGAGTGIFTKRLVEVPYLDLVALEFDWACYHILLDRIDRIRAKLDAGATKVEPLNKDGRTFNPAGKFDFIMSSFADHHIYFYDKHVYFGNIRRNLNPGGLFVVGDEFLPEHEHTDQPARQDALHRYHDHIISIAKSKGQNELVRLEEAALESGLRGWGDFKVSCGHYEEYLAAAGFAVKAKTKIGPTHLEDVGGIYVYTIQAVKPRATGP